MKRKPVITIIWIFTILLVSWVTTGCISDRPGVDAPKDIIHFPIGVAVHPAGRYAAVVNGNFNQAYKNGSVVIIDLKTYAIVADWTVPVGTFAGEVIFNHSGSRLFVTVRGPLYEQDDLGAEPSGVVVAYDIDVDVANGSVTNRPFLMPESRRAIRVAPDPFGIAIDYDDRYIYVAHVSGGEVTVLQDDIARFTSAEDQAEVDNGSVIRRCIPISMRCPPGQANGQLCGSCQTNEDCGMTETVVAGGGGGLPISEPNSCLTDPRQPKTAYCASYCEVDRTVVNDDGEVVRLGCPDGYRCEPIRDLYQVMQRKLSIGGNQVAISSATDTVYITHRDTGVLGVLHPYYTEGLGYRLRVDQKIVTDGYDLRGLVFNEDASKLFIAARNKNIETTDNPGILILDSSTTIEGCQEEEFIGDSLLCEKNDIIDFIEVNNQPANLAYSDSRLYLPIFAEDELFVVNSETRQVSDVVDLAPEAFIEEVGIYREDAGPYDIVTYSNDAGSWALISNFTAHEIAVVHLFDQNGDPIFRLERKVENRAKLYEEDQF